MCSSIIKFVVVGANVYVCVHIYVYICFYAHICTRACMCTCMYVCMYISVCVCINLCHCIYWTKNIFEFEFELSRFASGSLLSPLLFIQVLEALSRVFRTGVPLGLLYADDLMLIKDTHPAGVNLQTSCQHEEGQVPGLWCRPWCPQEIRQVPLWCLVQWCWQKLHPVLQCMMWIHKKCSGITTDWWLIQTMSAPGVMARLGPSMAELWLKWMSTAPRLMWKPLSAT